MTYLFLSSLILSSSSYAGNCTFFVSLSHDKLSEDSLKSTATGYCYTNRNSDIISTKNSKQKNSKQKSSKQKFPCPKCSKKLSYKYTLKRHIETCGMKDYSGAPFKCEKCRKGYEIKGSFKRHIEKECGKESEIPCPYCGRLFKQNSCVTRHIEKSCKEILRSTSGKPLHPDDKNIIKKS